MFRRLFRLSLPRGVTLGQGIAEMRKIGKETFDDSFSSALAGTSKEFEDSSGSLLFALLLALVLVYLILAAQFESFIDPMIIMFTVPLALAGAVLSLWLFGQTLNIFSEIGVIVLIGIVTKNGILIVEFANQRKAAGLSLTGSGHRCRNPAAATYPDDQPCHRPGSTAHRNGTWRSITQPCTDGDHHHRRT